MDTQDNWSVETAAQRVNNSLKRLSDNTADTHGIFSKVFTKQLEKDLLSLKTKHQTPVSGALVSVKALLDIKGEVTNAGTQFLTEAASKDAPVVSRLRKAGSLLIGHSNMSELAYSGLGLNPHYGTADNPAFPGHTPGGSTSGGAASVASGLVDIAIGSDTGGSLRIPAAFCGITGFKPSQHTVSRAGTVPLSDSLDSIGVMAKSVDACAQAWQVMAEQPETLNSLAPLKLHVSRNFGFDELDPLIAEGFEAVLASLKQSGMNITESPLDFLDDYSDIAPWHLTSVECRAHFETAFQAQTKLFDPRVHSRMARADEVSAVEYRQTLNKRQRFVERMNQDLAGRVLLLPTVAILPPTFESLQDDEIFNQQNLIALRNTTLANIGDGCSLALPFKHKGVVLSLMLVSRCDADVELLKAGAGIEKQLAVFSKQ